MTEGRAMMTVNAGSSPPVVFIAPLGTGGASWKPVIDLLTTSPTTVTYDRPGTGDAAPRPAPNPPLPYSAFADELAALLDEHGITERAVVVSHSVGSLIARAFASGHLGRVAGMIHVDGSIPRLSLWPAVASTGQPPDGDGPDATHFDLLAGEVEIKRGSGQPDSPIVSRSSPRTRRRGASGGSAVSMNPSGPRVRVPRCRRPRWRNG
jgi:pimeloyl-ACP methyl ester carboxylesterase